jgi:peptide/nickel transport system permease protein
MGPYIARRLGIGLILALMAASIAFAAIRLLPGDPIVLYTAQTQQLMTEERMNHLRREFGLDRPVWIQYVTWLNDVVHGRLGYSIYYHEQVSALLKDRMPVTLHLGLISLFLSAGCGIAMGIVAAVRRDTWVDKAVKIATNCGIAAPVFWVCVMMIYIFGNKLQWLPIAGYESPLKDLWTNLRQITMPVICLSIPGTAIIARQMRTNMLEVLRQDYIRTAWAKGMNETAVVFRHALKNSFIPMLTILGAGMAMMMGGAVIVETIFAIPGMGRLIASSIFAKDYVVIQSSTLILGLITIMINVFVDIAYSWCDPRIRYS